MTSRKHLSTRMLLAPIALSAFVATWGGWVGLATKTGFGEVNLLPGIVEPDNLGGGDWSTVNLSIALPLGVEAYAAYAMSVWFGAGYTKKAKRFAAISAVFSLLLAAAGQVSYHVLEAKQIDHAPAVLVGFVSCLPVLVIGMAAALHHLTGKSVVPDDRPGTKAETAWGRLRDAATGAAVARLNKAAETLEPVPTVVPEAVPAASQDVPPAPSRNAETPVPDPRLEPSRRPTPTVQDDRGTRPDATTRTIPQRTATTVPAAQDVETAASKASRDQQIRQVHGWRSETPRVSYAEIGRRLGVSKSEAGRLGQDAEALFGTTTPILNTVPFPLPGRDPVTVPPTVNGTHLISHTSEETK